ncbi:ubiquitin-related domain-containing protein, partial [Cladochytrium replicatum]
YTIHIGTLTGRTISLDVKSHHRVEDVKVRVYEDLGIAVDSQVLVYREKSLDDPNATLGEVGVKAGARLQLVVHMVGG